jgi:hypothetical protein
MQTIGLISSGLEGQAMEYYMQYHSYDKVIDDEDNVNGIVKRTPPFLYPGSECCITTNRPAEKAIGETAFLVVGFGKQQRYFLWEQFTVESVDDGEVTGDGWQLIPPQPITGRDYGEFIKGKHYSLGFHKITDCGFCSSFIRLANTYHLACLNDDTEDFCTELIDLVPTDADAYTLRAYVRTQLNRFHDARSDVETALHHECKKYGDLRQRLRRDKRLFT